MDTVRSKSRVLVTVVVVAGSIAALAFGAVRGALAVDDSEQCRDTLRVFEGSIWTTRSRVNQHEAMIAEPPADAGTYLGWDSTRTDDPTEYIDWMLGADRRVSDCESTLVRWHDTSTSELAQMREKVRVLTECIEAWSAVQPGAWPHPSTQCRPCAEGSVVVLRDVMREEPDPPVTASWCVTGLDG
ncbi:MAG: hypothetical protein OXB99_16290 [Acidimicrobiaceae bacterium]|nr:hypothetical protein [Acidimicrobiaceae bacterium]